MCSTPSAPTSILVESYLKPGTSGRVVAVAFEERSVNNVTSRGISTRHDPIIQEALIVQSHRARSNLF